VQAFAKKVLVPKNETVVVVRPAATVAGDGAGKKGGQR